jgi:hypothetical protein
MTTTNDELARLRTAFAAPAMPAMPAISAIPAPEPEACPPSDRIWLAVRGELPPDELREILDHLAACPACAEDWRIAMAFEEEARATVPALQTRAVRSTRFNTLRYRAWMAIAATIFVAVVGIKFLQPTAGYRGKGQAGVQSLVAEALPREAFVLRWTPTPDAESYNLEVSTPDLDPLFRADGLITTSYQVPEIQLARMRSGDKVLWTVTPVARGGGGLRPQTFPAILK